MVKNHTVKKNIRILLKWRNKIINFGTFDFKQDGSLVYSSAFHADAKKYPYITTGNIKNGIDQMEASGRVPNESGIHATLHPRGQVLQIRQHGHGPILLSKKMTWFPVEKEFLLMRITSPPLDECDHSHKEKDFFIEVPAECKDSIQVWVRLVPWSETFIFNPQTDADLLDWIIGFSRNRYWVCIGIFKSTIRSAPGIFYPV
jgi:hypothetical protein